MGKHLFSFPFVFFFSPPFFCPGYFFLNPPPPPAKAEYNLCKNSSGQSQAKPSADCCFFFVVVFDFFFNWVIFFLFFCFLLFPLPKFPFLVLPWNPGSPGGRRRAPAEPTKPCSLLPSASFPAAPQALGLGASLGFGAPHRGNGFCDSSNFFFFFLYSYYFYFPFSEVFWKSSPHPRLHLRGARFSPVCSPCDDRSQSLLCEIGFATARLNCFKKIRTINSRNFHYTTAVG